MGASGTSRGWLIHLVAGMALGGAVVLVAWIVTGGQPFGRIIGSGDVSEPTTTAAARLTAVERRAGSPARRSARLRSRPPALVRAPELEPVEPKAVKRTAKAHAKAAKAKPAGKTRRTQRAARPRRKARSPVVRVVAPPAEPPGEVVEDPVAAVPEPAPAATPRPAPAAPPVSGAGGGSAKPSPPGPTYWVGEG